MLKIAVIDDHELVLDGICAQLAKEEKFDIIGAFTEVEELKLCLKCKKVDILIMDLMLKDIHGFELIKQLKQMHLSFPKIILISGFYDPMLHKRANELGVKAFLPKETSTTELISTIINVASGNCVIPDTLLEGQENHLLTEVELKILKLIAEEYSNAQISKELFIIRRTVDTQVTNICTKLNVTGRVGAVREAVKLKLV